MGVVNLPPNLYTLFNDIQSRLTKLENAGRFTLPNVATDPSAPRNGDLWLNTTSNTPKYVDNAGTVTTLGGSSGGGSPFGPRYIKTGYFYAPIGLVNQGSGVALTANVAYAVPIYIPSAATAIYLAANVAAVNGASGGVRMAIYTNSTTDDYPNALVAGSDTGVIPTDTVSGFTGPNLGSVSCSLTTGIYWLAMARQGVSNPTIYGYAAGSSAATSEIFPTGILSSSSYGGVGWSMTGVSGAFPATWSATKILNISAPATIIGF